VVGTGVGNYAPNFNLVDLDGEGVSLTDFAGRPVLINFWASWCPPCRQEMPYLQQIHNEQAVNGLAVLAINIQESPAKVKQFLSENDLSIPVLFDLTGTTSGDYGIVPIPTTFFVDGEGVIRQKVVGAFPNQQAIERELRKIMP
jgi:thiol-disulfide isomerase/thioredoxin